MTNRLADLETNLGQRPVTRKKAAKQKIMRGALERTQQPRQPAVSAAPMTPPTAPVAAQGLTGRLSRWPTRGRTQAFSAHAFEAISYDVPGKYWVLAQPSGMACWATVFTMLKSWRSQREMTIEQALATVGQKWVDIYKSNKGLSGDDKPTFISTAGLVAEPPQSYSIEGWENLLRNYGPVWVTTDEAPGAPWAIHARIITGIHGDGTPENTKFKIVDPAGGRRYEESIAVFIPKYEEEVIRTGYMRIQVVHWQTDARAEVRAQSVGRRLSSRAGAFAAPAAVPIASAIIGATMTRILNNTGDISWELDQLQGLKHVGNDPKNAGNATYQNKTIQINGPHAWLGGGLDHIYVNSEISFQHNGRSLGNVEIAVVNTNDAMGAGLIVKANIMDDANAYVSPPGAERFAAIKIRIHYRFTFTIGGDYIYIDDIVLYGNGSYSRKLRKTQ